MYRHGAGLLFCSAEIQPHTSVYSAFCAVNAVIPPIVSAQPSPIPDRQKRIQRRLRHAGAYHSTVAPPAHTRYQTPRRTLYRSAQPPIIIKYIRVQHTANHASPAGSAPTVCGSLASAAPGAPAEGSLPPPVPGQPGGGLDTSHAWLKPWLRISLALAWHTSGIMFSSWHGRRGTIDGCRRISFRAFAR